MNRFATLPRVEAHQIAAQALARRLGGQGMAVDLRPLPAAPYLSFELRRSEGSALCHVQAHTWAGCHLPELPGLDWQGMAMDTVAGLTALDRPLQLHHPALSYMHAEATQLSRGASDVALPVLSSDEGPVWIERMDWALPPAPHEAWRHPDLALRVDLQLGSLRLSARRLCRLRRGDIVLLPQPIARAFCGTRALFDYHLHPESITVSQLASHDDANVSPPPTSDEGSPSLLHDLADLPLSLQVQLCDVSLTLEELGVLQPGSVLTLPAEAYRRLQLRHGGQQVAVGELVQIGDALGVRLSKVPGLK